MKTTQFLVGVLSSMTTSKTNSNLFSFSASRSLHLVHHHEHPAHS